MAKRKKISVQVSKTLNNLESALVLAIACKKVGGKFIKRAGDATVIA